MQNAQATNVIEINRQYKDLPEDPCDHFGGCPECGQSELFHIGRDEWFACRDHKVKWLVGSNLFSAWREMTEEDFRKNREILKDFEKVEPRRYRLGEDERKSSNLGQLRRYLRETGVAWEDVLDGFIQHYCYDFSKKDLKRLRKRVSNFTKERKEMINNTTGGPPF